MIIDEHRLPGFKLLPGGKLGPLDHCLQELKRREVSRIAPVIDHSVDRARSAHRAAMPPEVHSDAMRIGTILRKPPTTAIGLDIQRKVTSLAITK